MILEWIYGVIILTVLLYLIYPIFSKSSTKRGAAIELTGHIAKAAGVLMKEAGDRLKSEAIEMEFRKILVGDLAASPYSYGKTIHIHVNFKYDSFREGELSSEEISELINTANNHDQKTKVYISRSEKVFEACEKFKIEVVYIFGSRIYAYDKGGAKKESKIIGTYIVGKERLELFEPVQDQPREPREGFEKLRDLPTTEW